MERGRGKPRSWGKGTMRTKKPRLHESLAPWRTAWAAAALRNCPLHICQFPNTARPSNRLPTRHREVGRARFAHHSWPCSRMPDSTCLTGWLRRAQLLPRRLRAAEARTATLCSCRLSSFARSKPKLPLSRPKLSVCAPTRAGHSRGRPAMRRSRRLADRSVLGQSPRPLGRPHGAVARPARRGSQLASGQLPFARTGRLGNRARAA